jgi:serine-protein kinase ATM
MHIKSELICLVNIGRTLTLCRYHPSDIRFHDAATMLRKKRAEVGSDEARLSQLLTEIRKRFRPVMRHYFTERHKTPMAWFSMRLNYSRSVATTSIVGHILGLGDRHTSNILMDSVSGEVVHIDLGIAFDQVGLL